MQKHLQTAKHQRDMVGRENIEVVIFTTFSSSSGAHQAKTGVEERGARGELGEVTQVCSMYVCMYVCSMYVCIYVCIESLRSGNQSCF